ncbi:hypothetical protein FJZ28_05255, partial [Candidatus Peregrinibacteria bacterium]|nr:hypothetical protein [Candidatus Peregrinibacteria bacterium]
MSLALLRIRPPKDEENERGPLYMESAVAALHSLPGKDLVSLEIGMMPDGKISFFTRAERSAVRLIESQLYAQYPDIDIENVKADPFVLREGEIVVSMDLKLADPEVFPIKRHPQFDDMLTRVNIDPIAGITSSLARYPEAGMRAHVAVIVKPLGGSFRKRSLRFLPLLSKGLSSVSTNYAKFFTRMQLARGWRRAAYFPVAFFLGGFRAWPGFAKFVKFKAMDDHSSSDPDEIDQKNASARSHDREDPIAAA